MVWIRQQTLPEEVSWAAVLQMSFLYYLVLCTFTIHFVQSGFAAKSKAKTKRRNKQKAPKQSKWRASSPSMSFFLWKIGKLLPYLTSSVSQLSKTCSTTHAQGAMCEGHGASGAPHPPCRAFGGHKAWSLHVQTWQELCCKHSLQLCWADLSQTSSRRVLTRTSSSPAVSRAALVFVCSHSTMPSSNSAGPWSGLQPGHAGGFLSP